MNTSLQEINENDVEELLVLFRKNHEESHYKNIEFNEITLRQLILSYI